MSRVKFAEICDICSRRSAEYTRWNHCRVCGADVCTACDMESQRDEETARTLCRKCFSEVAATNHTPGPWKLDREAVYGYDIRSVEENKWLGCTYKDRTHPSFVQDAEAEANALLIAAAPELLEVLKDVRGFLKRSGYDTALVGSVIAKAEGK